MITPKLEALIWEGKAFYKSFVAGGSQRHSLSINEDRFIIITDITYFNSGHFPNDPDGANNTWAQVWTRGMNTQVTILGERQVNRFLFRNNFVNVSDAGSRQLLSPVGSTKIDTYLLHTTEVAFSFSFAQDIINQTVAVTDPNFYALNPPTDYGKNGQPGALAVTVDATVQGTNPYIDNFSRENTPGIDNSKEFSFPVDQVNNITASYRDNSWAYPILHVNYIEIIGLPNNFQI